MAKKIELTDPKVQGEIKDFILLMLGAPVVKIELDDSQLDMCVSRVCEMMKDSPKVGKWSEAMKLMVAQDGALAQAKLILGRVRAKFGLDAKGVNTKSKSGMFGFPMDGQALLNEGSNEYQSWQLRVFGKVIFEDFED